MNNGEKVMRATWVSDRLNVEMELTYDKESEKYSVKVPSHNCLIPTKVHVYKREDMQTLVTLLGLHPVEE